MIGQRMSISGDVGGCSDLLALIAQRREVVIVVDDKGKVTGEYENKMGASSMGRIWLAEMASRHKIVPVEWKSLNQISKPTRVELLDKHHFDKNDIKFVETAAASATKRLVSEDTDYSDGVCKCLKNGVGVVATKSQPACEFLEEYE